MKNKAPENTGRAQPLDEKTAKNRAIHTKKYLLSGLFLVALVGVTFYVIFKDSSVGEIWSVLKSVKLLYVAAGIACMLGFLYFQGLVLSLASHCLNVTLNLRQMLQYSAVGFFYSGITPSAIGGQPMQFYHLRRDKMSPSKATLILFIANIAYQIIIVVFGLSMFFFKLTYITSLHSSVKLFFFLGLCVNVLILLILFCGMFSENLLRKLLKGPVIFLSRLGLIRKQARLLQGIENYLKEFKDGVALIKANSRHFVFILLSTGAHFILYHMVPFFVYKAFGLSGYSFLDIAAISAVLYVAINMFPLPGSVGAAESGFILMFKPLFSAYILPAMLLSRLIGFYTIMLLSGALSAFAQLRPPYDLSE